MTERTITADEVMCPKCCVAHNPRSKCNQAGYRDAILHKIMYGESVELTCKCGCRFTVSAKTTITTTEVQSEKSK